MRRQQRTQEHWRGARPPHSADVCEPCFQKFVRSSSSGRHTRQQLAILYELYIETGCQWLSPVKHSMAFVFRQFVLPARRAGAFRGLHTSALSLASKKDYYELLGVDKGADKKDIKKKYYQLAKKYHPDQNKDDPAAAERFAEIQNAYEVLSDDSKRQAYDNFGHDGPDMAGEGFDRTCHAAAAGSFHCIALMCAGYTALLSCLRPQHPDLV